MQKKKSLTRLGLRVAVLCALLSAFSIVFGKYLAIGVGDVLRFSFENLPVIFAGMALGPLGGVTVGVLSDLVGCVLVGYAINPLVTVGAAVIGLVSGFYRFLPKRSGRVSRFLCVFATVISAHLLGSVVVKTFGLAVFYSMPIGVLMLWRLLNYAIISAAECLILYLLFENKSIKVVLAKLLSRQ